MMTSRALLRGMPNQRGFTLVEAIVVMVITGILAGIMVLFIRQPVKNYADAAARAEISDAAELSLRRMTREIHTALPNSIRVNVMGNASLLEFIPTKAGGLYLSEDDGAIAPNVPLNFKLANSVTFTVVGPMPVAPYAIAVNDAIVVYNLGTGFTDADAYAGSNRVSVTNIVDNLITFEDPNQVSPNANNPLAAPFIANRAPNTSPGHRFQVASQPVTFVCVSDPVNGKGTLTRVWDYGFQPNQVNPTGLKGAQSALMANNVLGCQFNYAQAANQQSAIVGMTIALARPSPGAAANNLETVTLSHQIHVDNTP